MSRVIDEHRLYLSDQARVSAFARALEQTVRPGDVVLDLGSGTGILGLLACRAGAGRVYAVDDGGMAQAARDIVRANDFGGRIQVIHGHSTAVTLPEHADLLVSDQIGHFGFDAGLLECVADARRRLLKPDARLVPSRLDLWVAPVDLPHVFEAVRFWGRKPAGFDMAPLGELAANSGYPTALEPEHLLGTPTSAVSVDLSVDAPALSFDVDTAVERTGTLHGIGAGFSARLSADVMMSNSPLDAGRIARRGVVFPVDTPTEVHPGDIVRVRMRIRPAGLMVSWTVEVCRDESSGRRVLARFAHSTLRGMLVVPELLARTRADFVPNLTPRGRARLSVLTLCDGRRPLAEIEREVWRRHPDLFAAEADAAEFVAEVVTRYSA